MGRQLSKTGGTPTAAKRSAPWWRTGSPCPSPALNNLRREALESLRPACGATPLADREFHPGARYENRNECASIGPSGPGQVSRELLALEPALVYVPLSELAAHPELWRGPSPTAGRLTAPDRLGPGDPRPELEQVKALGVTDALVNNLGMLPRARAWASRSAGDYGLEIYNAQALKAQAPGPSSPAPSPLS